MPDADFKRRDLTTPLVIAGIILAIVVLTAAMAIFALNEFSGPQVSPAPSPSAAVSVHATATPGSTR